MKNILLFTLLIFALSSCQIAKVVYLKSNKAIKSEAGLVWENDSIKITHKPWAQNGTSAFSFTNKLDIPIYIDWFKSSLMINGVTYKYWLDEEKIATVTAGATRFAYDDQIYTRFGSVSAAVIVKPERLTFVAPKATIIHPGYSMGSNYIVATPETLIEEKSAFNPRVIIQSTQYSKESTPLTLRNFITYSTDEKLTSENYIDLTFWIEEVKTMSLNEFLGHQKNGEVLFKSTYPYVNAGAYFIIKPR